MGAVHSVGVSGAYSTFFWIVWGILIIATGGLALVVFPVAVAYKLRVINRTRVVYVADSNRVKFQRGRIFALDDDIIPVRSIDNVKIDRSVLGRIFGWCNIDISTRADRYRVMNVSTSDAEKFREAFLVAA